jgi:hypothetical protein
MNRLGGARSVPRRHRRKGRHQRTIASLVLEILLKILLVLTFPLWIPLVGIFFSIWAIRFVYEERLGEARRRKVQEQARQCIQGTIEAAWGRCSDALNSKTMVGYSNGFGLDLGDEMMSGLAQQFPNEQAFFLRQLLHPNPVLACYVAVCLRKMGGLEVEKVPAEVFQRTEVIRIQMLKESGQCMLKEFVAERCARHP